MPARPLSVLLMVVLSACGSSRDRDLRWEVSFESPGAADRTDQLVARLFAGECPGAGALYDETFTTDDQPALPPTLGPGDFCFSVEAWDSSCSRVGGGCASVELPQGDGSRVVVGITATRTTLCPAPVPPAGCSSDAGSMRRDAMVGPGLVVSDHGANIGMDQSSFAPTFGEPSTLIAAGTVRMRARGGDGWVSSQLGIDSRVVARSLTQRSTTAGNQMHAGSAVVFDLPAGPHDLVHEAIGNDFDEPMSGVGWAAVPTSLLVATGSVSAPSPVPVEVVVDRDAVLIVHGWFQTRRTGVATSISLELSVDGGVCNLADHPLEDDGPVMDHHASLLCIQPLIAGVHTVGAAPRREGAWEMGLTSVGWAAVAATDVVSMGRADATTPATVTVPAEATIIAFVRQVARGDGYTDSELVLDGTRCGKSRQVTDTLRDVSVATACVRTVPPGDHILEVRSDGEGSFLDGVLSREVGWVALLARP